MSEDRTRQMALLISRAGVDLDNTDAVRRVLQRAEFRDLNDLSTHLPRAIRLARQWQSRTPGERNFELR